MTSNPLEVSYNSSKEFEEFVMQQESTGSDDPFEILAELEEEIGIPLIDILNPLVNR
jgi:hypothetical protein